ncbi:MAG: phage tail sheath family protein [Synergistaceae bacterium]|nr:phage tail sheath family protein [Synergistaceae bacterium]
MAFRHGVYKSEVPTSLIAPAQGESGLPVIVGTAPVFMTDKSNVNQPKLCYTYAEAVRYFGYSSDWENYTLCEFIYSQFALFAQAPCVLINVFDPAKHCETLTDQTFLAVNGKVNLGVNIISAETESGQAEINYDDDGYAFVPCTAANMTFTKIVKAKPSMVTSAEVIGGVSGTTGKYTGLELVNQVFPKFGLVPGLIGAPKFSENSGVAAIMRAKGDNINGLFTCCSVVDIPSGEGGAKIYSETTEWKNQHNYVAERQIVCWPKIRLDDKTFHMSTQLIGLMNKTDHEHSDIPYKSPSNEMLQMDSCVNEAGEEIGLDLSQANYLNSQGIVTAVNFIGGWRAWGNRTGTYPANSDPKDCWIAVRRMFDFIGNQWILTFWQNVDQPMTPRLIRTIVNTFNLYLNSLAAREMLLGGRVKFLESENFKTDLLNGILKFHIYMTPPIPVEVIEGILEFDVGYLDVLYNALR